MGLLERTYLHANLKAAFAQETSPTQTLPILEPGGEAQLSPISKVGKLGGHPSWVDRFDLSGLLHSRSFKGSGLKTRSIL